MGNAELLARLQQWATSNGVARDPYVARLINAIERQQDLSYWATLNPFELLPSPESSASRDLRISRRLAMWRNVIIFIPLALTWYSIAEATSAFEEFVSRNATATANFLEFWQNGYGILPEFWRIGSVARLDVYIILVIIAMSLASGILHARAQRAEAIDHERSEHERMALALDISQYLHGMREVTATSIDADVADAIRAVRQISADLVRAAEQISAVHSANADVAPKLSELLGQLTQLTDATRRGIVDAGTAFGDTLQTLMTAVAELDAALRGDIISAGTGLAAAAKDVEQQAVELQRRLSSLLDTDR